MSAFEFWLDINCSGQSACTVFGEIEMPVRPQVGERISFHQEKGSSYEFQIEWPEVGWSRANSVSVEIEEISHYGVKSKSGVQFKSAIRAVALNVRTIEDARTVRDFLTKQIGSKWTRTRLTRWRPEPVRHNMAADADVLSAGCRPPTVRRSLLH
jgi:hypothetical protein